MRGSHNRGRQALAAVLFALVLCVGAASAAFAQADPYSNDEPTVKPSLSTRNVEPEPDPPEGSTTRLLPFTGGDVSIFLFAGLGAISAGALILRRSRRAGNEV